MGNNFQQLFMSMSGKTIFSAHPDNIFLVKATYWISLEVLQAKWADGAVNFSRWWGIRDLKKKRKYAVVADRCVKCGFLEHYATEETK